MTTEELPPAIRDDFTDLFQTELKKHYEMDRKGLKLLINMLEDAKNIASYRNTPNYIEDMKLGILKDFTARLEYNLYWVQPLIVDYLTEKGLASGNYQLLRKIALEKTIKLINENF